MNAEVFRHNLRELLRSKGLKQHDVHKETDLSYSWIRKVCSQGLTRKERRNEENLKKLCEFLEVSPIENLWNPKLLDQQSEASIYASKVEEILRTTHSNNDSIRYESVGENSVVELVDQIDRVHESLAENRETLEDRRRRHVEAGQRSKKVRRPSQPSEYAEKIRALIRDDRPEVRDVVSAILRLIDGAYHYDDWKRLEGRLKKEQPDTHKQWLSSFGGNVGEVIIELEAASSGKSDEELLEELATHEPPVRREATITTDAQEQNDAPEDSMRRSRKGSQRVLARHIVENLNRAVDES